MNNVLESVKEQVNIGLKTSLIHYKSSVDHYEVTQIAPAAGKIAAYTAILGYFQVCAPYINEDNLMLYLQDCKNNPPINITGNDASEEAYDSTINCCMNLVKH